MHLAANKAMYVWYIYIYHLFVINF